MKAYLHAVRIAPKKANLIARLVRGLTVPDATEQLRRTNKKAARIVETLLRSAVANASHNDRQDPQMMVIKSIIVNQGQAYQRGMPMARGRQRPYRKFMSHISLTLGFPEDEETKATKGTKETKEKKEKVAKEPSQKPKTTVKKTSSPKKSTKESSDSSVPSDSSVSS